MNRRSELRRGCRLVMPSVTAARRPATAGPALARTLESLRVRVDRTLLAWLPPERGPHRVLHQSMRYSVRIGGKRLRPCLVLMSGRMLGARMADLLPAACALEMIHTYSLIHDDLPAMDDDDLRRGQPSNHKVFGEAMAILAGDGLLTLAFETIARRTRDAALVAELVRVIGAGAGHDGMVGGQAVDITSSAAKVDLKRLQHLHACKTAALFRAAVEAGGIAGHATAAQRRALRNYGHYLGLAFQVADDVLDVTADSATLGKTAGKDQQANKLTYPALLGIDRARARGRAFADQAKRALRPFGPAASLLNDLADFVVERVN